MKISKKELNALVKIAAQHISAVEQRGDLEERRNDEEDFIETSVWGLEAALIAAYELGKANK